MPLLRQGDTFVEITWEQALDVIAEKWTKIKTEHGPDALAFIASSKCTNEESYLMQKLARQVVGTNNIDNCSRYCQTPASMGLQRTVGYGADSGSIADIEKAALVVDYRLEYVGVAPCAGDAYQALAQASRTAADRCGPSAA